MNSTWTEWDGKPLPIVGGDPALNFHVPPQWSDAEKRERFGLHLVRETSVPAGKRIISYSLIDEDGEPRKLDALVDVATDPLTLDETRAAKFLAIVAQTEARLAAGAPVGGLHVALDADARADMGAVATTAIAAREGAVPWPEGYARGFITIENVRIPMPTPAEGLAVAAVVGDHYAALRQHSRDLKDLVEAAETIADVDAIDEKAGWPG
ncbi:DUF4376 domain-containing protein [Kaistia sp. MMO-174]|uniref:DUF4376 domain-containing protein n=1 Tax=Kaistia sp. MMO-174 TaxID=3081256 RepID=UPI003015DEFA